MNHSFDLETLISILNSGFWILNSLLLCFGLPEA
jgi:hypothetical protein